MKGKYDLQLRRHHTRATMDFNEIKNFYNGKRIFLTGHTGFKGSWLSVMLKYMGAEIYGYSLAPTDDTNLYDILELSEEINNVTGDIRNYKTLERAYVDAKPDIVIHLAAQPIVRESYKNPRYTYETNVMGTVNILECLRNHPGAISFLNVTTDKVYENNEQKNHAFKENDKLDGNDPYSNSKSCSELVTHSYKKSFFGNGLAISTARAGNVIGGGDFAKDRIVPDCVRSVIIGNSIAVRNPLSIRPYQHVLEPLTAYLMIAMKQVYDEGYADYYNIGPKDDNSINTSDLVECFVKYWGEQVCWEKAEEQNAPQEAHYLQLDCSKIRDAFCWEPVWNIDEAIYNTVEWYKAWYKGKNMKDFTLNQMKDFLNIV